MIRVDDVEVSFGPRALFRGASMHLGGREHVALVGPNGSGKTTLLEVMCGLFRPDAGRVQIPRDIRLGYLAQETDELRGRSLWQEVRRSAPAVREVGRELAAAEAALADADNQDRTRLAAELGRLEERYRLLGGYSVDAEVQRVLTGLGFAIDDLHRPTESFSGGWLMRIALAKLLVSAPDVLLLDEPTNHLDLESVVWLEGFLRSYRGAFLVVAHDREFLDGLATRVIAIDGGTLDSYPGNFSAYEAARESRARQAEAAARNQQQHIARTEAFIERFRAKATKARQVQSRIKALEKMERIEVPAESRRSMHAALPAPPTCPRTAIELVDVSFSYDANEVFRQLHLVVERGHKLALVGPNGAGKTTLLKLLAGVLAPAAGDRLVGGGAVVGYFAQHQIEALDAERRVIDELETAMPPGSKVRGRDVLGRFLFSGDEVFKRVGVLSGGERTRLALAKLLVGGHNVLCLDEPTNHLDIESREALAGALKEWPGTFVLITHDRHLMRAVANRIAEVGGGDARCHEGGYDNYEYRQRQVTPTPAEAVRRPSPARQNAGRAAPDREARRGRVELRQLEREIEGLHAERDELRERLGDAELHRSGDRAATTVRRLRQLDRRIDDLEGRWSELVDSLDGEASRERER